MATVSSYLEVLDPDDIRIVGTRVGLEHLLWSYHDGFTAEELAMQYPTVSLEQVHGVIAYYLGHRAEVDAYLARCLEHSRKARQAQAFQPMPEVVQRIRKIIERREQG